MRCSRSGWVLLVLACATAVGADPLPDDAAARVREFRNDAAEIQAKADARIAERIQRLVSQLQELQTAYTKAGKLDEAVAIRDAVRLLQKTPPAAALALVDSGRLPLPPSARGTPQPSIAGGGERTLPKIQLPESTAPGKSRLRETKVIDGMWATYLDLPVNLVDDVVWSPDGDAFFTLTREGVLSRMALDGFVEQRRLDLAQQCNWLAMSARGLVVGMRDLHEVWVIDPGHLSVRKRIEAPGVERVLTAPSLKFAYAAGAGHVFVLNLDRGTVERTVDIPTDHARITPDGRFYFARAGAEQLFRYRIEGMDFIQDLKSPPIGQNSRDACVSADSKFVCLPSGGGNRGAIYSTYVYSIDDLEKPVATLHSGPYPARVAFDPKAHRIYAESRRYQLIVFTDTADKKAEASFTDTRGVHDETYQLSVCPQGGRLLVVTASAVVYVEPGH